MKNNVRRRWILLTALFLGNDVFSQVTETGAFAGMRMNQLQLIGSHNSYKPGIDPALWNIIYYKDSAAALSLQYGHISIIEQLNLGLRNLEIDVVYDPQGGRYTNPVGLQWIKESGHTALPYDTAGELSKPGLKVMHVPGIDFRSHHLLFADCLQALKQWSAMHPGHLPVFITMNTKDEAAKGMPALLPFTKAALDSIDLEIRAVMTPNNLITPDDVRGESSSLKKAILTKGWPLLDNVKGRFLFVLDETGEKMEAYKSGHSSLQKRVMFVNEKEGSEEAAFMIINNAKKDSMLIKQLVKKGYIIRTRADANTTEARSNNYSSFEAAKNSGAQIITTDYYLPSTYFQSTYRVQFENGKYIRKNNLLTIKN
ncbi:MAG: phosphatidylinositol-specific phospholipase C1-like protein [Bacteroidota bacterium]